MTVSVPSPFEAKASWVPGSNRHASTPWPIGTVVTSAPLVASEIAMSLLRQPLNSRWWTRSMASPVGDSQGDRKSTRLNSSHLVISYAVFCLKKKKKTYESEMHVNHV